MGLMTLALLLTIQAVATTSTIAPSERENCTVCDTLTCDDGETDCYLQCTGQQCPLGYTSQLATGTCNTTSIANVTTTPRPIVIPAIIKRGNASATEQTVFDCWKCRVENCSRCPQDEFMTNCTECYDGYRLETVPSGSNSTGSRNSSDTPLPVSKCVWIGSSGGGGGGGEGGEGGGQKDEDGGGSSDNAGAIAGGVVAGGVVLLAVVAIAVALLWRRNKRHSGNQMMLSMMKQKKQKKSPDSEEDERSESRYTKSPVGTIRDPPSMGGEISEVEKLPPAPEIPQTPPTNGVYDKTSSLRQGSVHAYGHLEFKADAHQQNSARDQEADTEDSVYNNVNPAGPSPPTSGGSQENYSSLGPGDPTEQGLYIVMSGRGSQSARGAASHENGGFTQDGIFIDDDLPPSLHAPAPPPVPAISEDDVYLNDPEAPPLTEDNVYRNDPDAPPLTQEDVYVNEAPNSHPATQDELYLNQGVFEEETVYQNT